MDMGEDWRKNPLICGEKVSGMGEKGNGMGEKVSGVGEREDREVEKIYVQEVYDRIAEHFSHTRHNVWKGVGTFIEEVEEG